MKNPNTQAVTDFEAHGWHPLPQPLDQGQAAALLADIRATRNFDVGLFLSEEEFNADPQYKGVNPQPGRNLLERFGDERLAFVERAEPVTTALSALLGAGYRLLDRKLVCGVPAKFIPEWLRDRILGNPVNNLGPYIRPEYRDVTYFYGIDFHQDLIDYKDREADFLTLYVYLHPVGAADAPLHLLQDSHLLGASVFPHSLERLAERRWRYANGAAGTVDCQQVLLTGAAGYAAMWHACTLHGTQPDVADHERISLRYLFAKGDEGKAGIDGVNAALSGPLSLGATRVDLDAAGAAVVRGNAVNES